jgi:hypothetical protein
VWLVPKSEARQTELLAQMLRFPAFSHMYRQTDAHTHQPWVELSPAQYNQRECLRTHHVTLLPGSAWWPPWTFLTLARRDKNTICMSSGEAAPPLQLQELQLGARGQEQAYR